MIAITYILYFPSSQGVNRGALVLNITYLYLYCYIILVQFILQYNHL